MELIKDLIRQHYHFGRVAYEAYCDVRDHKSATGQALPPYQDVQPDIQFAWAVAARAVIEESNRMN